MLSEAVSVSITTDAATMNAGDSYVTVTAHWIDTQWNIMSCVLGISISNGICLITVAHNMIYIFFSCQFLTLQKKLLQL